jgi:hypothetical protein
MSTIRSPFSDRLITWNFSSVMIAFRQFLTGIILGDEDLHFPCILGTNANAFKWGNTSAT